MTLDQERPRSADTRARILEAARDHFVRHGYDRATIRGIAADARIDPSMVMRYFGSKEKLFAVAADIRLRLPDFSDVPGDELGARLVGHFVEVWDGDATLVALLKRATVDPPAAERMREVYVTQVIAAAKGRFPDEREAALRAGLCATQVLGVALCRYVLRFPPTATMGKAELVAWYGPTLQRYLTAPAPQLL
ncbi:MAG: TetR family transcriptional regulator [Stackebrandtia sp.]